MAKEEKMTIDETIRILVHVLKEIKPFPDEEENNDFILDMVEGFQKKLRLMPEKAELKQYGGQGYHHSKKTGKFEVRTTTTMKFTQLESAIKYYESLDEEKSIWDCTMLPELLDCHVK